MSAVDNEDKDEAAVEGQSEEGKKSKQFTANDVQKIRLDKLMKNIDKPIEIVPLNSIRRKEYQPPDFVRNVMGSSAGAGSGEFHVYRHLRRKEFARLRGIEEEAKRDKKDVEYLERLDKYKLEAEERTAKKRAKRLKKKQKGRNRKKGSAPQDKSGDEDSEEDDDLEGSNSEVVAENSIDCDSKVLKEETE
ncbi:PRKR-interacting protein 1 [Halotydeus destructor]|nr:PRKR-interacting protein 1 [Halotydeus destructor]